MTRGHCHASIRRTLSALLPCLLLTQQLVWAHTYVLPPSDEELVGNVKWEPLLDTENMVDAAVRLRIGQQALQRANPNIDRWSKSTDRLQIPTRHILPRISRNGLVLNLPEMRLYHYWTSHHNDTQWISTYAVSIGRQDWQTPVSATAVIERRKDPDWTPPGSIKEEARAAGRFLPDIVPAGPDNPLGQHALRLSIPGYLLHGTNRPQGIGMRVTHGCVRLYPADIKELYYRAPVGTVVQIINEPVKVGWYAGALYLEVHPPLEEFFMTENELVALAADRIRQETRGLDIELRTQRIREVIRQRTGLPVRLSDS